MNYEIKGADGTLLVDDDKVVVRKKAYMVAFGKVGDRTIFYGDIASVEFKKSGFSGGYIKFIVAGANETKVKNSAVIGSRQSFKDQNSITFKAFEKRDQEVYDFIMKKMAEVKKGNGGTIVQQSSNLDELKKLAELKKMGAISESEFEEQKKKLLNEL